VLAGGGLGVELITRPQES